MSRIILFSFSFLFLFSLPAQALVARVACTQDARQCPDGSYVSRTGPNCQFAPCPGEEGAGKENRPVRRACTKDAKACPDGSSVGRMPPTCAFAPCPGEEGDAVETSPGEGEDGYNPDDMNPPPSSEHRPMPPRDRGPGDQIMCTMEAKICPDGTGVGRTGPNCEFAPCPGEPGYVAPTEPEPHPGGEDGSSGSGSTAPGSPPDEAYIEPDDE
jgi:hypothetical protein